MNKVLMENKDDEGQAIRLAYFKYIGERPFYRCEVKLKGDEKWTGTGRVVFHKEHSFVEFERQCKSWGF